MKRKLLIVLCIVILILIGVGVVFYVMISRPAYKPGVLSERNDLEEFTTPPSQKGVKEGYWRVDDSTDIYHFSQGEGKPALVIHGGPGIPHVQPWAGLKGVKGYEFFYYHQKQLHASPNARFLVLHRMKTIEFLCHLHLLPHNYLPRQCLQKSPTYLEVLCYRPGFHLCREG